MTGPLLNAAQLPSIAVAISTTGDAHRLPYLSESVKAWATLLPIERIAVTVDGDNSVAELVTNVLSAEHPDLTVIRVGQLVTPDPTKLREGRLGVAANKNTGLAWLHGRGVEHMFLCDDDTWPLGAEALTLHVAGHLSHSLVCWGRSRLLQGSPERGVASWSWPRGVLMYLRREVLGAVGGFVEAFGPGGHEHVEWSNRIHRAGFTPVPYPSPAQYQWDSGTGARQYWHCEDMPRLGEPLGNTRARKQRLTSVRRRDGDWEHIEAVMAAQDGRSDFVPFRSADNGRFPATLLMCMGT